MSDEYKNAGDAARGCGSMVLITIVTVIAILALFKATMTVAPLDKLDRDDQIRRGVEVSR